ncbi:glycosyltransferase family 25 protein [Marinobacter xestospongiae]
MPESQHTSPRTIMPNSLPIYLVSLDKDHQRRQQLAAMLPSHHQQFRRISAVDGRELPAREFFRLAFGAMKQGHRLMLPGEVGCSLSHIQALEQFLDSGARAALIVEDDIIGTDEDLNATLALLPELPENGVLICGGQEGMPARKFLFGKATETPGLFRLARYSHAYVFRTCCYAVTRSSARRILDAHAEHLKLADAWGSFFRHTNIDIYFANLLAHPEDLDNSHLEQERTLFHTAGSARKPSVLSWLAHRLQRLKRKWGALMCRLKGYQQLLPRRH